MTELMENTKNFYSTSAGGCEIVKKESGDTFAVEARKRM